MNPIEAILLGLVQGLTEFLPVSSSGHLAIGKAIFGIETTDLSFEIIVHLATVLATIVVFRKEIWDLVSGVFKFRCNEQTKYVCMILVSLIPVFIVGMFFKDYVESVFGSGLLAVGAALLLTSLLLAFSESGYLKNKADDRPVSYRSSIWMGLAQALAVLPGLSRSGATIATGLLCGVKKDEVAKFSFLMVLIPVLGEAFLDVLDGGFAQSSVGALQLGLGFVAAFLSGLFACRVMISIVRKAKLKWFALYCCIVGAACIVSTLL